MCKLITRLDSSAFAKLMKGVYIDVVWCRHANFHTFEHPIVSIRNLPLKFVAVSGCQSLCELLNPKKSPTAKTTQWGIEV